MSLEQRVLWGGRLLRLLGSTWRTSWDHLDRLEQARARSPGGNVIYAAWHNALATLAWTHRHRDIQVLVSHHDDGEWIARILGTLGYGLVRGSSRRGGTEALFQMGQRLESGHDVAVTVDGPLGPRYDVHPGVLLLARRSGRPIVPVVATASRRWVLGSWDALRLPMPGSRVVLRHGAPVWIAPGTKAEELESARRRLRDTLHGLTIDEEGRAGHRVDLRDVQDHRSRWERWSEQPHPPWLLRGLSRLYGVGVRAERVFRRRPPGRGERPWVVGIGNLEAGGTGKTPVLIELASAWERQGLRCAVLTRGYGGGLGRRDAIHVFSRLIPTNASDETRLMREMLPESVALVVSRSKAKGFAVLRARNDLDVVLVDDAFQTASVPVDRHLVLLDARAPFGNGHLLPAGRLREPVSALERADVLLFTRCPDATVPEAARAWAARRPCFMARETAGALRRPSGNAVDVSTLAGSGVATLCGIGRPRAFEDLVQRLAADAGFTVRRSVRVPDHGALEGRLRQLRERLDALGCAAVLLTSKDACRLPPTKDDEPLLVVEQRLEIEAMDDLLRRLQPADHWSSAKSAISTTVDP